MAISQGKFEQLKKEGFYFNSNADVWVNREKGIIISREFLEDQDDNRLNKELEKFKTSQLLFITNEKLSDDEKNKILKALKLLKYS